MSVDTCLVGLLASCRILATAVFLTHCGPLAWLSRCLCAIADEDSLLRFGCCADLFSTVARVSAMRTRRVSVATGVFQNRGQPRGPALDFLVLRCCDSSQALASLRYVAGAWSGVGRAPRGKPLAFLAHCLFIPRATLGSVSSQTNRDAMWLTTTLYLYM